MNRGVGTAEYFQTWYTNRDWRFYRMFLADILQHAEEPGPILDVGAGLGYLVEAAQRWGLECFGIEGSAAAVEMGNKRFPGLHVTRHSLSDRFPFPDGHFAAVLFNQVIEHLEPEVGRHALSEILRVLRPNGMLLLLSPSCYNEKERREDPTHIHMYSPSELQSVLQQTGFSDISPFDEPLPMLGTTPVARRIMGKVFRVLRWERLSASANARAFKRAAT
jgi:SAM-dependent methyltransferase